ncbi:hypothetical protein GGR57DRAFT_129646 [Xylariaceae sp. FL1272]|nr:hypothetical protein GGR57DRAFT_129646 [Xylariaceae sp. FL1272]
MAFRREGQAEGDEPKNEKVKSERESSRKQPPTSCGLLRERQRAGAGQRGKKENLYEGKSRKEGSSLGGAAPSTQAPNAPPSREGRGARGSIARLWHSSTVDSICWLAARLHRCHCASHPLQLGATIATATQREAHFRPSVAFTAMTTNPAWPASSARPLEAPVLVAHLGGRSGGWVPPSTLDLLSKRRRELLTRPAPLDHTSPGQIRRGTWPCFCGPRQILGHQTKTIPTGQEQG